MLVAVTVLVSDTVTVEVGPGAVTVTVEVGPGTVTVEVGPGGVAVTVTVAVGVGDGVPDGLQLFA